MGKEDKRSIQPSPAADKRPATSSDHEDNLIRDDSGEEGTYAGQQQTGLNENSAEASKKPERKKKDTDGGDAKSRYGA